MRKNHIWNFPISINNSHHSPLARPVFYAPSDRHVDLQIWSDSFPALFSRLQIQKHSDIKFGFHPRYCHSDRMSPIPCRSTSWNQELSAWGPLGKPKIQLITNCNSTSNSCRHLQAHRSCMCFITMSIPDTCASHILSSPAACLYALACA